MAFKEKLHNVSNIKILVAAAIVTIGFVLIPFSASAAESTEKPLSFSSQTAPHDEEFNGCIARFIDHDYPSSLKLGKDTKTGYSYAWLTFSLPRFFTVSHHFWEHDMKLNKPFFTESAFAQYTTFLNQSEGFKDYLTKNPHGMISSFLLTAPRLWRGGAIQDEKWNILGWRWFYKAVIHSTYSRSLPVDEKNFLLTATVVYTKRDDSTKITDLNIVTATNSESVNNFLFPQSVLP